jgi:hypothetical protein
MYERMRKAEKKQRRVSSLEVSGFLGLSRVASPVSVLQLSSRCRCLQMNWSSPFLVRKLRPLLIHR